MPVLRIVSQALPALLIFSLAAWAQKPLLHIESAYLPLLSLSPVLIFALTAVVGLWFRQRALATLATWFASTYFLLQNYTSGPDGLYLTSALTLFSAVNLILFGSTSDQSRFNTSNTWIILLFVLEGLLLLAFYPSLEIPDLGFAGLPSVPHPFTSEVINVCWMATLGTLFLRSLLQPQGHAPVVFAAGLCIGLPVLQSFPQDALWATYACASSLLLLSMFRYAFRLAFYDQLTGLPNRRFLEYRLARLGRRYTIAMLDVDHFKKFNDKHGHDVGDQVLRMVASRLKRVGGRGFTARYGGEEFTVVFKGCSVEDCQQHLEQLREDIAQAGFTLRRKARRLSVTISIGASQRDKSHKTSDSVIKRADQALYRAKKAGRNCIRSL